LAGAPPIYANLPSGDAGHEWRQETLCVPSRGRALDVPATLGVTLRAIDGLCGPPAPGEAWIDDFEVTTDPACAP
jgi:hypothetical protein